MKITQSTLRGRSNDFFRAGGFAVFAAALLLPSISLALDPPEPLNVLFVANGY